MTNRWGKNGNSCILYFLGSKITADGNCSYEIKRCLKLRSLSRVGLFVTPWTVAYKASLSMGFFMQEYWSGLPLPSPGDLPDPEIEPGSPTL